MMMRRKSGRRLGSSSAVSLACTSDSKHHKKKKIVRWLSGRSFWDIYARRWQFLSLASVWRCLRGRCCEWSWLQTVQPLRLQQQQHACVY